MFETTISFHKMYSELKHLSWAMIWMLLLLFAERIVNVLRLLFQHTKKVVIGLLCCGLAGVVQE